MQRVCVWEGVNVSVEGVRVWRVWRVSVGGCECEGVRVWRV